MNPVACSRVDSEPEQASFSFFRDDASSSSPLLLAFSFFATTDDMVFFLGESFCFFSLTETRVFVEALSVSRDGCNGSSSIGFEEGWRRNTDSSLH